MTRSGISDAKRKQILDGLGQAASDFRDKIYRDSFSGEKLIIDLKTVSDLVQAALLHLEQSIRSNKRTDNLYHAYNLMTVENAEEVSISYLSEMLEGQVAVLSSGFLSAEESLEVLDALKESALFREDQFSYILYPNKNLPRFLEKNNIQSEAIAKSELLKALLDAGTKMIVEKDALGEYHFNGEFRNANDLATALKNLDGTQFEPLAQKESKYVMDLFEEVFNHKAFTGRSGTFFGYEGLGSIYWHMVSKLSLAVQESCLKAIQGNVDERTVGRLLEHYYEICEGIGVHKPPSLYGAFPTDPYSHTPQFKGAQQPGMTGQVKEDILCRIGEFGVFIEEGKIVFSPSLLRKEEFTDKIEMFKYVDINNEHKKIDLNEGTIAFTFCQVPVIYNLSKTQKLELYSGSTLISASEDLIINKERSSDIFKRNGEVSFIKVELIESQLK